ncbi:MAG: DNA N-6-adenine-methyltransferase [Tepidisphaeraceae bacterium]
MSKILDQFGNPMSDSYCTPPWLTTRLPLVDLDPCSNPRSTVRSKRRYSLEMKLDGLRLPWTGTVFLNFPYSTPLPWVQKLLEELGIGRCKEAIVLCKLDSSTKWWKELNGFETPELWTFDDRVQFDEPQELIAERVARFIAAGKTGGEKSSNNFCSAIVHHRRAGAALQFEDVATRWVRVCLS